MPGAPSGITTPRNPRFQPPRSAYLHVPFCRHRCGYCNFTLIAGRDDLISRYLLAIKTELSQLGDAQQVDTLYFGGGTPTHLPPPSLIELLETVGNRFQRTPGCEFSVEANPLDLTPDRVDVLRQYGVTRISLGVQSFQDRWLQLLERDHRYPDVVEAIERCRRVFPAVSIDLMFGLPGQSLADWKADLSNALRFAPQHLSVYGLTFERGTSFWSRMQHGELVRCPEERERGMYELAIDLLGAAGFEHYEVSNFAVPGFRCRHNEAYWLGRTYFAAGPGAARHVAGRRETNHRSTTTYLTRVLSGQSAVAESEFLSDEEAARERFVFGLRRLEGIQEADFAHETGFGLDQLFGEPLAKFVESGFLERRDGAVKLTRSGLMVSDALWPELLR